MRRVVRKKIGYRVGQFASCRWMVVDSVSEKLASVIRGPIRQWNRNGHGKRPISLRQRGISPFDSLHHIIINSLYRPNMIIKV